MKIALFYDWFNQWGGAERVLLDILKVYPEAELFGLVWDKNKTKWLGNRTVKTSFLQDFPLSKKNNLLYTYFYPIAAESLDLSGYDIVISTTSSIGHALVVSAETLFVCYCHNVNRYVYNTPKQFKWLTPLLNLYKKDDLIMSKRPDLWLCNSFTVAKRIKESFGLSAEVVNPGVDTDRFALSNNKGDYYLVVSRLVRHKRIDIVIEACEKLGKRLVVVGEGRDMDYYKRFASSNTEFWGKVDEDKLIKTYQGCKALICPQIEDYGLTPIEAQSCGKGVISLNKGGVTETVVLLKTGVFFDEQTSQSLINAINTFEDMDIDPNDCRTNALKFSSKRFMLNFERKIKNAWEKYKRK